MKIIHISDIHLTIPGEEMGGLNPHARLEQAMRDIADNHPDAVRIIVTGDLAHWGERAAYESLKPIVEAAPVPMRLLIGNHDNRSEFLHVFADHPQDEAGFVNHAETVDGIRFIYLDSVGERTHAGHFCAKRRHWLENELEHCERARIFLHHNPMLIGLPAEDKIALVPEDRAPLKDLLKRYNDRIDYIHFGHVHAPIHGQFAGIPFASVPSTGNQSLPDLREQDMLKSAPMQPGYYVVLIDGSDTTIHQIPFAWDGVVRTSGTAGEDGEKQPASA